MVGVGPSGDFYVHAMRLRHAGLRLAMLAINVAVAGPSNGCESRMRRCCAVQDSQHRTSNVTGRILGGLP